MRDAVTPGPERPTRSNPFSLLEGPPAPADLTRWLEIYFSNPMSPPSMRLATMPNPLDAAVSVGLADAVQPGSVITCYGMDVDSENERLAVYLDLYAVVEVAGLPYVRIYFGHAVSSPETVPPTETVQSAVFNPGACVIAIVNYRTTRARPPVITDPATQWLVEQLGHGVLIAAA